MPGDVVSFCCAKLIGFCPAWFGLRCRYFTSENAYMVTGTINGGLLFSGGAAEVFPKDRYGG